MLRLPRTLRELVSIGGAAVLALSCASGCGKGRSPADGTPTGKTAALRMVSQPVRHAQANQEMKYQAVVSKPGAATWVMESGPDGARIDEGGNLRWKASASQAGDQTFTIAATMGGQTARQTFKVTTAASVMQAHADVDPQDPNGATLAVDAPLSAMRGTAIQIDPGALPPGPPVAMTISSLDHPPIPAMAAAAGLSPGDLRPVELGPSGLAFRKPVKIQLPISAAVLSKGNPVVQTYDYASGTWQKIKLLSIDKQNGIAVAEARHFSTYVVTPDVKIIDLTIGLGGAGTACGDGLLVRAPLAVGFDQIPAVAINGYSGNSATVAAVLGELQVGQALQVLIRVSARAAAGVSEQSGWVLGSASKQPDGSIKLGVTSDGHAGAFLKMPPTIVGTDPSLESWLNGSRVDFVFGALGSPAGGAIASAEVSLYLVPAADADHPPPVSANAFGTEEVTADAPVALSGYDDDCDGAPNAWDPEPNGAAPPVVVGLPPGPFHVVVGNAATLKVLSPQADTVFSWGASDPSVAVAVAVVGTGAVSVSPALGGTVATAIPSLPGVFQVWVTGTAGGASTRFLWDVIAELPSVQATNTPPIVAMSASANLVRVGETVSLAAFGKDARQASLTYAWSASDPATLSAGAGPSASFTAVTPGDYEITCTASDGGSDSPPAHVTISVVSATANRPPGVPSVSPMSAALQHGTGGMVSMMMKAQAVDPDGDMLTYDFAPDPQTPPTFTLTRDTSNALFSTTQDGVYVFYVTATDTHGAQSPWAPVKIQVLSTLPATAVDADHDGYPAGFDCNDNDSNVFPGAKEICADGLDQNCDGRDLSAAECDVDGDRFSTARGDCDDHNPAVGPAAIERCDGVDNNCNRTTDEGFDVGGPCLGGMGSCRTSGKTVCNASYTGVVCDAAPGVPTPEVCDGVDNDCNGRADDVPGQITGDAANCGGCGLACPAGSNTVASCISGGCASVCAGGFVDADRDPANGCECRLTNSGVEACDGIDNDCNGAVDDGGGATYYDGPGATQGVGACHAGSQVCKDGQLVIGQASRAPMPEVCDGLDNDCNGKVDDGFNLLADQKNCGACGLVCPAGVACQMGKCGGGSGMGSPDGGATGTGDAGTPTDAGTPADAGMGTLGICNGPTGTTCTDLGADPANCGACGRACPVGQPCIGGMCTAGGFDCPAPKMTCPSATDPTKPLCTDPMFDPGNCGGCAKQCPTGVPCQMGVCQGTTPVTGCPATAPIACPSTAGGMICTEPKSDPANCGGCGKACAAGIACQNGVCGTQTCPAAAPNACSTPTGDICANFDSDPKNCGMCGLVCPAALACALGKCGGSTGPACPPTAMNVCPSPQGAICTNFLSDSANCGSCGVICPATLPCQMAMCGGPSNGGGAGGGAGGGTATCPAIAPYPCPVAAGVFCTDIMADPGNCGMCGRTCPAGTMCAAGVCMMGATGCAAPLVGCPTGCASLKDDPGNCGVCGKVCPGGSGCQAGTCSGMLTCVQPAILCGDAAAGKMYCTDPGHDPGNCGGCGRTCPANAICTNGACQGGGGSYQGLAACPGMNGAPLCTNLLNDPANCGRCGQICPVPMGCYGGVCAVAPTTMTCPVDLKPCVDAAGKMYCSNALYDSANCGSCGKVCPAGTMCTNATCVSGSTPDGGTAPADAGAGPPTDGGATPAPDGGVPTQPCPVGFTACMNAVGQQVCTDFNDPSNCGGCQIVCPATTSCMQKICR